MEMHNNARKRRISPQRVNHIHTEREREAEIGEMEAVGRTGVSVKKKLHKERERKMTL